MSPSPIEARVLAARALLEANDFARALAACEALHTEVPGNRDVLYMLAVALRHLGRIDAALARLQELSERHPRFSLTYQERGHCYVALRDAPRAIDAFLRAVNMNPALPASWRSLGTLYRMTHQPREADMAAAHVATLTRLPTAIVTATALFSDGDLALAERLIRDFLLRNGDHVEGMRLLARIGLDMDVLDDAEQLLEAVLAKAPDYHAARHDYALALQRRHKHAQAKAQLEKLLEIDPHDRAYRTSYAASIVGLGDHERALELYRQLLVDSPQPAAIHLSIAHSHKTLGRHREAVSAYRSAAAARPDYGDAYWSLANLKTYAFTDDELERMRLAEAAPRTAPADRYHLCFALGKALEDRGEYGESFRFYARGNALKKSESSYRPETVERNTQLQQSVCTPEFFAGRSGVGAPSPDPIFIVGLPRSGSTLLEQILASHSQVQGTHELAEIPRIVLELQGRDPANPRYPGDLRHKTPEEFAALGQRYLADTLIYRAAATGGTAAPATGVAPRFVDKMPNNFRHLGLIHLMLPNAKIIDARREPMACCFSNFKQLFAHGQEFTYSLEDIARYYLTYLELMEHWQRVLPGRILRVLHEDVVDDLEGSVHRLLDFCGLAFEPACLEFHKTARSIRTASSEQVRRPIFREGLEQWKHFAPWLGDLETALGDALVRYRSVARRTE